MRVTPSAVPDCAASVAQHQPKRQRSVRVSLIQQDRRDIGRVRRGGWFTWPAGAGPEDDVTPNMPQRPILTNQRRTRCSSKTRLLKDAPPRRSGRVDHPAMAWRCRREKLRRSCGGRVSDGGDNGATGDLGGDRHRKTAKAMDDAGGAVDGVLVVPSMGSSNRRAGPFPPWTPVSLGQQSIVRPAGGDRSDEKTLDGQVGDGDDVTAADLGPDPDAARLSLNEFASMDGKQYRERCPFVDEPAVCVRHDSLASRSARDWLTLRAARGQPIHPSSAGIIGGRAGVGPGGALENRAGSPADRARRARSIPPGASPRR